MEKQTLEAPKPQRSDEGEKAKRKGKRPNSIGSSGNENVSLLETLVFFCYLIYFSYFSINLLESEEVMAPASGFRPRQAEENQICRASTKPQYANERLENSTWHPTTISILSSVGKWS